MSIHADLNPNQTFQIPNSSQPEHGGSSRPISGPLETKPFNPQYPTIDDARSIVEGAYNSQTLSSEMEHPQLPPEVIREIDTKGQDIVSARYDYLAKILNGALPKGWLQ